MSLSSIHRRLLFLTSQGSPHALGIWGIWISQLWVIECGRYQIFILTSNQVDCQPIRRGEGRGREEGKGGKHPPFPEMMSSTLFLFYSQEPN